ncbi:hypothetical protein KAR91_29030 [Candidatus Pacearchaeota archaeon]|nr:hypothetical protein [Candidatus Pacearchaeota archaeon]
MAKHISPSKPTIRSTYAKALNLGNSVVVDPSDDLTVKYDWLKSSDRDAAMGALSATNRRTLILSPGIYTLLVSLILDIDYVDILSMTPFTPKKTIVQIDAAVPAVLQTCDTVNLSGFFIYNAGITLAAAPDDLSASHGFIIQATDNSDSEYHYMYFDNGVGGIGKGFAYNVIAFGPFGGLWNRCEATALAFRIVGDVAFTATMYDCVGGNGSFVGDGGLVSGRGTCSGKFYRCKGGTQSFASCTIGAQILSDAYFEDCVAISGSFGVGTANSGTFVRCVATSSSFGGCPNSGTMIDCEATNGSFCVNSGTNANNRLTGTMRRCRVTETLCHLRAEGATIIDCEIVSRADASNNSSVQILDSNCKILNSILIATGTGNSITADSALNAQIHGCAMNIDKHANVTNLIGAGTLAAGNCVVDSNVSL